MRAAGEGGGGNSWTVAVVVRLGVCVVAVVTGSWINHQCGASGAGGS
jgi:hypothetical protein